MPLTQKDKDRKRRQRRRRKIKELKQRLNETTDKTARKNIIEHIHKVHPWVEVPEA